MFYFGYLFWEYPTNRLLQRLPLAKYSAFNVIMWGLTLCCMAAVKDFAGAMTVRFFLGVFEAAVSPGFALFTSQWVSWNPIFGGICRMRIVPGGCGCAGVEDVLGFYVCDLNRLLTVDSGQSVNRAQELGGGSASTDGARFWEVSSRTVLPSGPRPTLCPSSPGSLSS